MFGFCLPKVNRILTTVPHASVGASQADTAPVAHRCFPKRNKLPAAAALTVAEVKVVEPVAISIATVTTVGAEMDPINEETSVVSN